MTLGDTNGYYLYQGDDGTSYVVKLSKTVAAQGGFTAASNPFSTSSPIWPYHARHMRHVSGVSAGGKRGRCPIASPSNALYTGGGQFTLLSGTYTVIGAEGERRPATNIA